jgi:lipid-binding SYLF domain-containing protein
LVVSLGLATIFAGTGLAKAPSADTTEALARFNKEDPSLAADLKSAAGYAVFSSVKKAGLGIGGARGGGELIVGGQAIGKTTLTQASIGFQAGGQEYAELIIFETAKAVADFRTGRFALGAQATAVAIKSGAAANAKFRDGVKVLTIAKGGLMYEASVAGQKFSFDAY